MTLIVKAYAEPSGASQYQRSVARQYANQYGVSMRAANRAVNQMANGRAPFQPSRGRNATPTSVAAQAARLARG